MQSGRERPTFWEPCAVWNRLSDYLRTAFTTRWNLLFFGGGVAAAFISGFPEVILPLVAAGNINMHLRSRKPLHDVLTAIRTGKPVGWDANHHTVTGNPEAIPLMRRAMREPWNVLNPKYTG